MQYKEIGTNISDSFSALFPIGFILVVAALLRFYALSDADLCPDEVSAILRTRFSGFQELISGGILPDGHPLGAQVFLYYWIKCVPITTFWVRFPFVLASLLSIVVAYDLFRRWYSRSSALLVVSFMSAAQYFVMYGQLARPYAFGVFLLLLYAWSWERCLRTEIRTIRLWAMALIVVSGFLALSMHYFVWPCWMVLTLYFMWAAPSRAMGAMLVGMQLVVMLPQLPILITHLSHGGLGGWLGAPSPGFLAEYWSYVNQHNEPTKLILCSSAILGLSFKVWKSHMWWLCLLVFVLPLVLGYVYSVSISPVLQYSSLIFGYPFLLAAMLGWIPPLDEWSNYLLTFAIVLGLTAVLFFKREHYRVFYQDRFAQAAKEVLRSDRYHNSTIVCDADSEKLNFHLDQEGAKDTSLLLLFKDDYFGSKARAASHKAIIYCQTNYQDDDIELALVFDPHMKRRGIRYLQNGSIQSFEKTATKGYDNDVLRVADTIGSLGANKEWGPPLFVSKMELLLHGFRKNDKIVSRLVLPDSIFVDSGQVTLVMELWHDDKRVLWKSGSIPRMQPGTTEFYCSILMAKKWFRMKNPVLKCYLWNREKIVIPHYELELYRLKGNPYLFGWYEAIKKRDVVVK